MIRPSRAPSPEAVARHYDELDPYYRALWGEHLHHGLFDTGREDPQEAAAHLVREIAQRAAIQKGDRVCDVGCGYAAPARLLAKEYGAAVTGITISPAQFEVARERCHGTAGVNVILGDWMENDLEDRSFEAVISIEGSEHMPDFHGFFREAGRVLRVGGRMVVCAWLAADRPSRRQVRYLLEPICREGRLVGLGDRNDYRRGFEEAGFRVEAVEDWTARVSPTWTVSARRVLAAPLRGPEYRRFVRDGTKVNRVFALTVFRIWVAYRTGALRYGVFTARKP